jgi:hypothetical protein
VHGTMPVPVLLTNRLRVCMRVVQGEPNRDHEQLVHAVFVNEKCQSLYGQTVCKDLGKPQYAPVRHEHLFQQTLELLNRPAVKRVEVLTMNKRKCQSFGPCV